MIDKQTNLDYTIKFINDFNTKSLTTLNYFIKGFKNGEIDFNIYNETLNMIYNIDYKKIIKNLTQNNG